MSPRSEKIVFNSFLNFRRVTHLPLCLLETQVMQVLDQSIIILELSIHPGGKTNKKLPLVCIMKSKF